MLIQYWLFLFLKRIAHLVCAIFHLHLYNIHRPKQFDFVLVVAVLVVAALVGQLVLPVQQLRLVELVQLVVL